MQCWRGGVKKEEPPSISVMVKGNNEINTDASFAVLVSFISKRFEAIGKNAEKQKKNRKKEKKCGTDASTNASFAMSNLLIPKRSNATRKHARRKAKRNKRRKMSGRERKDKWIKKKKEKKKKKCARCWVFERTATMLNRRRYTPAGNVKKLFDDST